MSEPAPNYSRQNPCRLLEARIRQVGLPQNPHYRQRVLRPRLAIRSLVSGLTDCFEAGMTDLRETIKAIRPAGATCADNGLDLVKSIANGST